MSYFLSSLLGLSAKIKACIFSVELAVSYSEFPLQQETVSYGVLPEKSGLPCLTASSLCGPYLRVLRCLRVQLAVSYGVFVFIWSLVI